MTTPTTRSLLLSLAVLLAGLSTLSARADAERVLIIGDSMMQVPAHALKLELNKRDGVASMAHTSIGTGLARLDAFDWMAKIDGLLAEFNPDTTLVWFGVNDRQPMKTDEGIVQLDDAEWKTEYARRVGAVMDKLTAARGAKVYWLEIPVMRDGEVNKEVELINAVVKAEAGKRGDVNFFETNPLLTRKPGQFAPYLIGRTGRPIKIRIEDGIHLSREGADIVAEAIVKELY